MPILDKFLKRNPLLKLISSKPSSFMMFAKRLVEERLSKARVTPDVSEKTHPDLLSHFIAAQKSYPDVVTDFQVAMYSTTNVVAGALATSRVLDERVLFLAQQT